MLLVVLVGIATTLLCLVLQGVFLAYSVRGYVRLRLSKLGRPTKWHSIMLLSLVMTLMLIANIFQMAIWAGLFMAIGEFSDFETALYHSGVNFVTLGYGDIVMSEHRRMLGALEGANGILMFGVSTATMTAAMMDIFGSIRKHMEQHRPENRN